MGRRISEQQRCSYAVVLDAREGEEDILELSRYLSTFSRSWLEVVVLDPSIGEQFERNRRILRWVATHVSFVGGTGAVDDATVNAALGETLSDKLIVATSDVRYTAAVLAQMSELLEVQEAVEPQDYFDPLPWWSGIEMSRMLLQRAFDANGANGATLGVRRAALRTGRRPGEPRLIAELDVHATANVFVRRRPPELAEWLNGRSAAAACEFEKQGRTVLFFAAAPLLLLLAVVGGAEIAATYAGAISVGSIVIALRGGLAARGAVPLRACLFAPLWLAERSISVYVAAIGKWRTAKSSSPPVREGETSRSRVASGE